MVRDGRIVECVPRADRPAEVIALIDQAVREHVISGRAGIGSRPEQAFCCPSSASQGRSWGRSGGGFAGLAEQVLGCPPAGYGL